MNKLLCVQKQKRRVGLNERCHALPRIYLASAVELSAAGADSPAGSAAVSVFLMCFPSFCFLESIKPVISEPNTLNDKALRQDPDHMREQRLKKLRRKS